MSKEQYEFQILPDGRAIKTVTGTDDEGNLYVESSLLEQIAPFVFTPSDQSTVSITVPESDDSGYSMFISCPFA